MNQKTRVRQKRIWVLVLSFATTGAVAIGIRSSPRIPPIQETSTPSEALSVRIEFDFQAAGLEQWTGTVVAEGVDVAEMKPWRFYGSDRLSLNTFDLRRTRDNRVRAPVKKGFILNGKAGPTARISVETSEGNFAFRISELGYHQDVPFLNSKVRVTRLLPVEKLTDNDRNDDYPSIAVADGGLAYAVWQSYSGQADEIRISKFNNGWRTFTRVPGTSGDVWRPQVALDARSRPWIAWSEQVDGNFDVYARALDEKENRWLSPARLSSHPFPDVDHHFVSDSRGNLWIVWQGFHGDNSDIFLRHYDGEFWSGEVQITDHPANDWEPRVAIDARGRAHVVWDSYRNGNYDVYLRTYDSGTLGPEVAVANTPLLEAHASVAVDLQGRVWVAWNEAGVNWGKDTGATENRAWRGGGWEKWVKTSAGPGTRLNDTRKLNLTIFEGTERKSPAVDIRDALVRAGIDNHDYPQLAVDPASGRLALTFHRWDIIGDWSRGLGARPTVEWQQAAVFYEGDHWSEVWTLPVSRGRISTRSAAAFAPDGEFWVVWPTDERSYRSPYQPVIDNVYCGRIPAMTGSGNPELVAWREPAAVETPEGHADEDADVAAIRSYRTFIDGSETRILRADLHRHTEFSLDNGGYRDGSLFDFYRYVLDAAAMDFGGVTDHNSGGDYEYWWWLIEKSNDLYYVPPAFTTLYGYERSVQWPGGHRNIFHTRRGIPLVSFFTKPTFNGPRPGVVGNPRQLVENDTKLLFESLRQTGGISIPHTTGSIGGTDWSDNDPEVEPVVEIYQGARVSYETPGAPRAPRSPEDFDDFREPGFVWHAYRKGYRLGTIASSDHWSTHISYAMVFTEEPTREAIIEAIKKRHTYGATDNIILDYRAGNHFMGEEFTTSQIPALNIRIIGTSKVSQIDIIKDEKVVYSANPNRKSTALRYRDQDVKPGVHYYYVRAIQDDAEMAWGSPIWIHYAP